MIHSQKIKGYSLEYLKIGQVGVKIEMDLKVVDIQKITLEECEYFASLGMYFIVKDGVLKGFTR